MPSISIGIARTSGARPPMAKVPTRASETSTAGISRAVVRTASPAAPARPHPTIGSRRVENRSETAGTATIPTTRTRMNRLVTVPASAGVIPRASRIVGSQFDSPWVTNSRIVPTTTRSNRP